MTVLTKDGISFRSFVSLKNRYGVLQMAERCRKASGEKEGKRKDKRMALLACEYSHDDKSRPHI